MGNRCNEKAGNKRIGPGNFISELQNFIKEFENQFFNKEKLSVSDINKIYKAFYDKILINILKMIV